jgi:hypothetical protein
MAGTLTVGQLVPDVGTNLYLNAQQYGGNVVIGNATTQLFTFGTGNTLTANTISANTVTSAAVTIGTTAIGAGNASIMKNRIINGAMTINQRGFSGTPDTQYTLDRWFISNTGNNKFTISQNAGSVTPPAGFPNYLGATSSSAYSVPAGELYLIRQYIEGFNTADLAWGTANAKTVTLSFQVYSSLTGTFGGSIQNNGNDRSYPFSYTVSSANTWTQISITIAGDTTGTWVGATNGIGMRVNFSLGTGTTYSGTAGAWAGANYYSATGATSVVGTNGATFYITGVQLEVGSSATGFEYVNYQTSLANCQRYYYQESYATGTYPFMLTAYNTTSVYGFVTKFPVTMRAVPTMSSSGSFQPLQKDSTSAGTVTSITGLTAYTTAGCQTGGISGLSSLVAGNCSVIYVNATSYLSASAEL